jgi:hypothetical protein
MLASTTSSMGAVTRPRDNKKGTGVGVVVFVVVVGKSFRARTREGGMVGEGEERNLTR